MAKQSKHGIAWTNETWNPIRGCSRVSEGCRNCYAEIVAARFSDLGQPYHGLAKRVAQTKDVGKEFPIVVNEARWTGRVEFVEKHLNDPLHWKKPCMIFVNSMSDLFHEKVPDEWIERIWTVMDESPQHTFQILTKRPERMREWVTREFKIYGVQVVPASHIWLGVSVEDQKTADERIPLLLQTPAAVRWVSAEPLLGPIDLSKWLRGYNTHDSCREGISCVRCHRSIFRGPSRSRVETQTPDSREPRSQQNTTPMENDSNPQSRRTLEIRSLSNNHVLRRGEAAQSLCPSCRMDDDKSEGYSEAHANQSSRRGSRQHETEQPGTGDRFTERPSQHLCSDAQTERTIGGAKPTGKVERNDGTKDSRTGRAYPAIEDSNDVRNQATDHFEHYQSTYVETPSLNWIVCGGESGPNARPCNVQWFRDVLEQCKGTKTKVFIKQLGSKPGFKWEDEARLGNLEPGFHHYDKESQLFIKSMDDPKGGDPAEWPQELRVREFPLNQTYGGRTQ